MIFIFTVILVCRERNFKDSCQIATNCCSVSLSFGLETWYLVFIFILGLSAWYSGEQYRTIMVLLFVNFSCVQAVTVKETIWEQEKSKWEGKTEKFFLITCLQISNLRPSITISFFFLSLEYFLLIPSYFHTYYYMLQVPQIPLQDPHSTFLHSPDSKGEGNNQGERHGQSMSFASLTQSRLVCLPMLKKSVYRRQIWD